MSSLFRLVVFICVLLIPGWPGAQPVKEYYFTHYTAESGLLSTEVNTVLQDADGYIWTGSVEGLQRFDGTRFLTFYHNPGDPVTIPGNNIIQLITDKENNLWLLTNTGEAGIFDRETLRFRNYPVKVKTPGSKTASVKRLIMDESGNVFLLFAGAEVITLDKKKNEFSWENNFFEMPPDTGVADFLQQPGTKNYWIGLGKGVAVYNRATGKLSYPGHNTENIPAVDALAKVPVPFNLFFDKKGRCWYQTWQPGLPEAVCFYLNDKEVKMQRFEFLSSTKTYYETGRIFEKKDGSIWITGLGLFARLLEDERKFQLVYNGYKNERSISYEVVTALTEDREGNMWVATSNNGLYRFNPSEQYFLNVSHINNKTGNPGTGGMLSFINTRRGTILAASWGDGFYHYDKNFNLIPLNIKGLDNSKLPSIWSMYASGDSNTVWMGGQPGVYAIDQSKNTVTAYNPDVLNNRTVRQIVEDRQGNLWLGMNNFGVFKWAATDKKKGYTPGIKRFEAVPQTMINKVTTDRNGLLWVGTAFNGMYVIDPAKDSVVLHFSDNQTGPYKLPEAGISCILDYDDSSMVYTTSLHVMVYNRYLKRSAIIGKPGLMKGYIASMEKDASGYIWISTTNGLYRLNIQTRVFVGFSRVDGIDNDHFIITASKRLPDGRMIYGSNTQFVVFRPEEINITRVSPTPKITGFKVMNKPLLVDSLMRLKRVELRYNNNSLEIEFSPMAYSNAFIIMYKLEGLDKDWKMAGKNNNALYTYLPSGKYTFLMKTIDAEARMSDITVQVEIRIIPPFWKSWWFFSLLLLLGGLLLFWFDKERMKRKEALMKMRSDIADNLHSEVNTALNNINILSEMARLKADKDPGKSKEYIEQIHTRSHSMIIAMDDMLWSLDPANDSMAKTTDRMSEYIDALKNRYGVNIDIAVDKKVETMRLNMKLRHEAFLIFKEGIKTLVTLGADNCHVYIRTDKGDLLFTTLFDSAKCNMQQLHNLLHRQDLERRLSQMQAAIEVDLHKNHSAITLRVPVI